MTGEIIGGWNYIWAAYAIVWLGLIAYSFSLIWRSRK